MPKDVHQFIATYLGYDEVGPERAYVNQDDVQDYELVYQLLYESSFLHRTLSLPRTFSI